MKLYSLGTAGWIPGKNETSCFLVEHKNELIMLDAGTGVSNLKYYQDVWEKYDSFSIILSHYHLDHLIGLIYLPPFLDGKKMKIYGPGKPAYKKSTEEHLNEMFQTSFFPTPISQLADVVEFYDYSGNDFFIGDVKIAIKEQVHTSPSFQIGIDDTLIYATDVAFDEKVWDHNLKGKVLLHECCDIEANAGKEHTALDNLITGICPEQFENIFLIHHNPRWTKEDWGRIEEKIKETKIEVLNDGQRIEL